MNKKQRSNLNRPFYNHAFICLVGAIILFSTLFPRIEADLKPALNSYDSYFYSASSSVPAITARMVQSSQLEQYKPKRSIPALSHEEYLFKYYSTVSQIQLIGYTIAIFGIFFASYQQACLLLDIPPPSDLL